MDGQTGMAIQMHFINFAHSFKNCGLRLAKEKGLQPAKTQQFSWQGLRSTYVFKNSVYICTAGCFPLAVDLEDLISTFHKIWNNLFQKMSQDGTRAKLTSGKLSQPQPRYRIVVVGDGGVGKSALTLQLIKNEFVEHHDPTIEDLYHKQVVIDKECCCLDILDTAGQEEFSALGDQYMRSGDGFLIVFSLAEPISYQNVTTIREKIHRVKGVDNVPIVVAANKCDLFDYAIDVKLASQMLANDGVPLIMTSAKTRMGVENLFRSLVREIRKSKQVNNTGKLERDQAKECCLCSIL